MILKLGTRSSNLALTQSRSVARMLEKAHPGLSIELVEIKTTGDMVTDKPLKSFGGAGVFVKELESALQDGRADFAVHSLKDMPTRQPSGLVLGAILGREDPRDVVITKKKVPLEKLPPKSVIGSGSMRRRAQLARHFPGLVFAEIRGNVETRIKKVESGEYAGTILARAGLKRLKLLEHVAQVLPFSIMLPAAGQGALGVECRSSDRRVQKILESIHQEKVAECVNAERSLLETLGGGCHLPVGALGTLTASGELKLIAALGLPDGTKLLRMQDQGPPAEARAIGRRLGKRMLAGGGAEILKLLESQG